jgi:hypothetical protein
MWQFINEFMSIVAGVVMGILAYRQMSPFHRLLLFQVSAWLFVFLMSYAVTICQRWLGLEPNNQWVLNLAIPIETSLLAFAAHQFFKRPAAKRRVLALYGLFLILGAIIVIVQGVSRFSVSLYILESFVVLILYVVVFYELFHSADTGHRTADKWMCAGLILYFACNLPYFCFMNFLNEEHLKLSEILFRIITDVLANVRYYCLAIGFWLLLRNKSPKVLLSHEQ